MFTPRRLLPLAVLVAAAALAQGAAAARAQTDPLAIEKDGAVKMGKSLEVGPNGPQTNEKGATIQGFNGRNLFQDSEKAGALRVGGVWGTPGIYSEKGDVIVGSQSGKIQLRGAVEAGSIAGKGAVPVGAILMWSGKPDQLPAGWALCNGQKVGTVHTPDLSGRFIVGYNSDVGDYKTIGNTGGEAAHTLGLSEIPHHAHPLGQEIPWIGSHSHQWGGLNTTEATANGRIYAGVGSNTGDAVFTGEAAPHENRPPYYVLAYIIYTGP